MILGRGSLVDKNLTYVLVFTMSNKMHARQKYDERILEVTDFLMTSLASGQSLLILVRRAGAEGSSVHKQYIA